MKEKLQAILKHAYLNKEQLNQHNSVLHLKTDEGESIYLNKDLLSDDQIQLLQLFLHVTDQDFTDATSLQQFWKKVVNGEKPIQPENFLLSKAYRFTHFSLSKSLEDNIAFEEAVSSFFSSQVTIIWNSAQAGFIVEYVNSEQSDIETESLSESIMTDFFVTMTIFIGSLFYHFSDAFDLYNWETNCFQLAQKQKPNRKVINKELLIPYIVTNELTEQSKNNLLQTTQFLRADPELLKTIKVFFECNLNSTLAAKKLFMHRNSLQYRIDKFIEKTGIDIKQFHQAVAIYLLIILIEQK